MELGIFVLLFGGNGVVMFYDVVIDEVVLVEFGFMVVDGLDFVLFYLLSFE